MAIKQITGADPYRSTEIPKITDSPGGLRGGWKNPFEETSIGKRRAQGRLKGSSLRGGTEYGGAFRRGMSRIGQSGQALSGIGGELMGGHRRFYTPAMARAQQYADVSEQRLVDEATMGVGSAYDKAQGLQTRRLSRYGVSPSSGQFQGQVMDLNLARAAAEAGARNKARITARDLSFGRNLQLAGQAAPLAGQAIGAHGRAAGVHGAYAQSAQREAEGEREARELQGLLRPPMGGGTSGAPKRERGQEADLALRTGRKPLRQYGHIA